MIVTHIKKIQDVYKNNHLEPMIIDKRKKKEDRVQDKEVFLYKPYDISLKSSWSKTLKLIFIQDKVNNLEKYMQFIQSPVKIILFYPPLYYKYLWPTGE